MEPAPVPSQACFRIANQQKSGSDTKKMGVWLEKLTFIHGQLYVAASMVGDPHHHHSAVNKNVSRKTRNVSIRKSYK